jgi:hypothetical protein
VDHPHRRGEEEETVVEAGVRECKEETSGRGWWAAARHRIRLRLAIFDGDSG